MVMTKEPKDTFIYNGEEFNYDTITGPEYNIFQGMNNGTSASTRTLSDICKIKNGVATLCNEVYIHSEKKYDEPCWRRCKTSSSDEKWIIYPYDEATAKVVDEEEMKRENPRTYEYLETQKVKLSNRDKGKKEYPKWYAYGRSQSLRLPSRDRVIYIPVFIDPTNIQYTIDVPTVYSGCLCIELTTDEYTNEQVIATIKKNIDYIKANSSKRGGGWINLSTKTLLSVPINE
jgi:hypothetical protein